MSGILLLFMLFPLLLALLIIALADRTSPLFIQRRLGRGKKPFHIYKLKTMKDGEVTQVGRVLRKTGIDEIPQLVNIFLGQMSFVGPRPLLDSDMARLGWTGDYYNQRWSVKPGITGLAQLGAKCHKKFTWVHDRYYVKNASYCLDLKILSLSIGIPLLGKSRVKQLIHKSSQS